MIKKGRDITSADIAELSNFLIDELRRRGTRADQAGVLLKNSFDEVDQFFENLKTKTQQRLGPIQFDVKKRLLEHAIERANDKPLDVVNTYLDIPHFKGKYTMLIGVAREQMERDVRSHYNLPDSSTFAPVRRLITRDLAHISQGDYILHVCGLFNLEKPITDTEWDQILSKVTPKTRDVLQRMQREGEPLIGMRYKRAIPYLLDRFPVGENKRDRWLRNAHPASVLLRTCSGFVFHPGYKNPSLVDVDSSFSFENVGRTLALKYFEAVHHDKTPEFFESAFVAQNPCYEAAVENIMNYSAQGSALDTIFHAKPVWDDTLPAADNVGGVLAWIEREMVRDYAWEKSIDLSNCSLQDINQIEGSKDFAGFLMRNEANLVSRMLAETAGRVPEAMVKDMVRDDIQLGLASFR